jgi:origin recognition complex subunit 2
MTKLSEDRLFAENYFNFISDLVPESTTNIKQFGKNEIPEPAEQRELISKFDQTKGHSEHITNLRKLQMNSLTTTIGYIRTGFNLLCYGYGSKQALLEELAQNHLNDYNVFTLSAFSEEAINLGPIAQFNNLLVTMFKSLLPLFKNAKLVSEAQHAFSSTAASKNVVFSRCSILCKLISGSNVPVLCLLHQIDSTSLRSSAIYECVSMLISEASVAFIASVDNPNFINTFTASQFEQMNWIWIDCTTMIPYSDELNRFVFDACRSSTAKQNPRAALIVLQSLTSNSRSIFKLLAAHQIAAPEVEVSALLDSLEDEEDKENQNGFDSIESSSYTGLSYHALFQKCQENFVVTAEANFRTQLTEFTDHEIFKSLEGRDGSILFYIPFYHAELRQILQDI